MIIRINLDLLHKLKNLHNKLYYPVIHFMNKEEFTTVATVNKFKQKFFPFPILFPLKKNLYFKLKRKVVTKIYKDNRLVALFLYKKKSKILTNNYTKRIFGTNSKKHPGVNNFLKMGNYFITGQIKYLFNKKQFYNTNKNKLKNVASLATRNIPHLGHELIVKTFIEKGYKIGITPTLNIDIKDLKNNPILKSWQYLLNLKLYKNQTYLMPIFDNSSLAGPKEAALQAIMRRNIGFDNFIVGRDHSGVKKYYKKFESASFLKKFEKKLNINILLYNGSVFCKKCNKVIEYGSCFHTKENFQDISSTSIKANKLKENKNTLIRNNLKNFL